MSKTQKLLLRFFAAGLLLLVAIQFVPYGRNHDNPATVREPQWDGAATRILTKRACFDCHSFETIWPPYAAVAPASWLVQYDVDEGRSELNFSDWRNGSRKAELPGKMSKEIAEGEMPPLPYLLIHPEARLSAAEKQQLITGLTATAARSR